MFCVYLYKQYNISGAHCGFGGMMRMEMLSRYFYATRMHSSSMRTASSSSRLLGVCLPQCMLGYTPLGLGLNTPPPGQTPLRKLCLRAVKRDNT